MAFSHKWWWQNRGLPCFKKCMHHKRGTREQFTQSNRSDVKVGSSEVQTSLLWLLCWLPCIASSSGTVLPHFMDLFYLSSSVLFRTFAKSMSCFKGYLKKCMYVSFWQWRHRDKGIYFCPKYCEKHEANAFGHFHFLRKNNGVGLFGSPHTAVGCKLLCDVVMPACWMQNTNYVLCSL